MSEFFDNSEKQVKEYSFDNLCPRDDGEIFGAYANADFLNKMKVLTALTFLRLRLYLFKLIIGASLSGISNGITVTFTAYITKAY